MAIRIEARRGILKLSLLAGGAYFTAMTLAHFFSLKYPILFIYWDTPFYAYQDKIIAFCAALYALVFFNAASNTAVVPTAVGSMVLTVVGLSLVTTSDALAEVLRPDQSTKWYWAQTALIAGFAGWLGYWARSVNAI